MPASHLAGHLRGDNLNCFVFGPIAENLAFHGADPILSFWDQIKNGPNSWMMFISCFGFILPAILHLIYYFRSLEKTSKILMKKNEKSICIYSFFYKYRDLFAGIALCCVSITSPLCDAFLIQSSPYDTRHQQEDNYTRHQQRDLEDNYTPPPPLMEQINGIINGEFIHLQKLAQNLQTGNMFSNALMLPDGKTIDDLRNGNIGIATDIVQANDFWNNGSRLLDRGTCVFFVAPSTAFFAWSERSRFSFLVFLSGFVIAWIICLFDNIQQRKNSCDFNTTSWKVHEQLHMLWHLILIVLLTTSCLWRKSRHTSCSDEIGEQNDDAIYIRDDQGVELSTDSIYSEKNRHTPLIINEPNKNPSITLCL